MCLYRRYIHFQIYSCLLLWNRLWKMHFAIRKVDMNILNWCISTFFEKIIYSHWINRWELLCVYRAYNKDQNPRSSVSRVTGRRLLALISRAASPDDPIENPIPGTYQWHPRPSGPRSSHVDLPLSRWSCRCSSLALPWHSLGTAFESAHVGEGAAEVVLDGEPFRFVVPSPPPLLPSSSFFPLPLISW